MMRAGGLAPGDAGGACGRQTMKSAQGDDRRAVPPPPRSALDRVVGHRPCSFPNLTNRTGHVTRKQEVTTDGLNYSAGVVLVPWCSLLPATSSLSHRR